MPGIERIRVLDSHTGGEPTRLVLKGGPDLGTGPLAVRRDRFREQFDRYRSAIVCEPRGADVLVGALLCDPEDPTCAAGALFFNNVGYLGMCGHGTIGLIASLAYLGRIEPGRHRVETPAGVVDACLHADRRSVSVRNVPAYRFADRVSVDVPGFGAVTGDVAYGGNWFFLADAPQGIELSLAHADTLTGFTGRIRQALAQQGITGANGAEIDHIELSAPSPCADSRNFVLCPGNAYDRSPCGTGTSAKLACLYADSKLRPGEIWRQESITGSVFTGSVEAMDAGRVLPTITGSAHITGKGTLLLDPADPLCWGVRDGLSA